jgi:hypothetical protein
MRMSIVGAMVSMDGVMQTPARRPRIPPRASSVAAGRCPIFDQVFSEELDRVFTETFDLLLGRKTYEMFAAYCPTKTKTL